VFCSHAYRKIAWSFKNGDGQGHKNWCGLGYGEEDVDFEVAPIPGKGVGLIAKRPIPIQFRILVEDCCSKDHPAEGTLKALKKLIQNLEIHIQIYNS
jgi:hypothetical protein